MRYALLAVAIGLLVVGSTAYVAQAAQKTAAAFDSRLAQAPEQRSMMVIKAEARIKALAVAKTQYDAKVQQIQQQQEQERQRQDAIARFGVWGPDLEEAAATYGQDPAELYRVMICESRGDAYADNGVCKGLFQFNPNTWAGTPYGGQSIFDGHAQIMAAAWMWSQGRKGEWTCA